MAIAYSIFGLAAFFMYAVSGAPFLTLPFGVLAPLFHLNLNFNLAHAEGLSYNAFLCVAAVLSYALTGWITGAAATICFNIIAKQTGGIDARYVEVAGEDPSAQSPAWQARTLKDQTPDHQGYPK